jgi:methylenetetrahydrofolate reductase (NADPH)
MQRLSIGWCLVLQIAAEQVQRYLGVAQGVHLMAIKAEERIPAILKQAGVSLPG